MKYFAIVLFFVSQFAMSQGNIFGYYVSKRGDNSQLIKKIQLNADWTFTYEYSGDLMYSWGKGRFETDTDMTVMLFFDEADLDSSKVIIQSLSSGGQLSGKMFFASKKGKLFPLDKDGKLNRKACLIRKDDEVHSLRNDPK